MNKREELTSEEEKLKDVVEEEPLYGECLRCGTALKSHECHLCDDCFAGMEGTRGIE